MRTLILLHLRPHLGVLRSQMNKTGHFSVLVSNPRVIYFNGKRQCQTGRLLWRGSSSRRRSNKGSLIKVHFYVGVLYGDMLRALASRMANNKAGKRPYINIIYLILRCFIIALTWLVSSGPSRVS